MTKEQVQALTGAIEQVVDAIVDGVVTGLTSKLGTPTISPETTVLAGGDEEEKPKPKAKAKPKAKPKPKKEESKDEDKAEVKKGKEKEKPSDDKGEEDSKGEPEVKELTFDEMAVKVRGMAMARSKEGKEAHAAVKKLIGKYAPRLDEIETIEDLKSLAKDLEQA